MQWTPKTGTPQGAVIDPLLANIYLHPVDEALSAAGYELVRQHSYHTTFPALDGWVRMRLRSILRTWHHGKGRGRGQDHQRWPNKLGLFA